MAHADVVAAVHSRLAASWSRCPVLADVNLAAGEVPAPPFLTMLFPLANSEQMSVGAPGANIWREEGVFQIVLKIQRGTGLAGWLQWGDELAALFRGKNFDGIQTFAPTTATFDDDNEDGQYFELSVAVPYQFDLIG